MQWNDRRALCTPCFYHFYHFFSIIHPLFSSFHFRLQSLGILGSAPAALLILSLFGLLLYLLTRCCDRKPRTAHSITSLKVTLSVVTVLCCAAIGLGKFLHLIFSFILFSVLVASFYHVKMCMLAICISASVCASYIRCCAQLMPWQNSIFSHHSHKMLTNRQTYVLYCANTCRSMSILC